MSRGSIPAMQASRIDVPLAERAYTIHVGSGLLDASGLIEPQVGGRRVLVVTDEHVAAHYLERAQAGLLGAAAHCDSLVLPAGEVHKTPATWLSILDRLTAIRAHRDLVIVALGGGVVGDLAGFAAASYMRGIDFVQCPTTLLAQVDASVGGKTGINHPRGKNLIGAFHQPRAVVIDVATLTTLPRREFLAGLAETVKYGAIAEADFFDWLERQTVALLAHDSATLTEAVTRACRCKAGIVVADEREQGVRALLNFGHTFGHAIETATGYDTLLHGEAVAIGMIIAARLSAQLGHCEPAACERLESLLAALELPTRLPAGLRAEQLWSMMQLDKKNRDGQVRLILMRRIGECFVAPAVDPKPVLAALQSMVEAA